MYNNNLTPSGANNSNAQLTIENAALVAELKQEIAERISLVDNPAMLQAIISVLNIPAEKPALPLAENYAPGSPEAWVRKYGSEYLSGKVPQEFFITKVPHMREMYEAKRREAEQRKAKTGKTVRWRTGLLRQMFFDEGNKFGLYFTDVRLISHEAFCELLQTDDISDSILSKAKSLVR